MKTKKLLSIAIIAALPFAANAEYTYSFSNTPANVPANGTVTIAGGYGPYQTAEIGANDGEHIASTAYVKGAYNDAIAAIDRKQIQMNNSDIGQDIGGIVVGTDTLMDKLTGEEPDDIAEVTLISSAAVAAGIRSQRVAARDTWGSDHTANVALITVSE